NTAMAIDVDTPTDVQDNLVFEAVGLDRGQLRTESLKQRPEYRQAKLLVGAAEATERQTFRNFFPDISGTGSYGGTQPQLNESWTLGLTFSWSLFDGGNRLARYQEAKANLEGSKQRLKSQELDIIQNVEQAEIAVEETQERIQAGQALVASAQEHFRLAQGRFDAGVGRSSSSPTPNWRSRKPRTPRPKRSRTSASRSTASTARSGGGESGFSELEFSETERR